MNLIKNSNISAEGNPSEATKSAKKANSLEITNEDIIIRAERLDNVLVKYFRTQLEVADLLGINKSSLSNYVNGRYPITRKFAMRLQEAVGINADYILYGNLPVTLNPNMLPIFEHNVPQTSRRDTKPHHGIIKQYVLQYEGNRQVLKPDGEGSVVNLLLGDLDDCYQPFKIYNNLLHFADDYNIPLTATIILKKKYKNNDIVLFKIEEEYDIGIFNDGKVTDLTKEKTYRFEEVEIEGRVVGKFENTRYNKNTCKIF